MSVPDDFTYLLEEARVFYRNLGIGSVERRSSSRSVNSKLVKLDKIKSELESCRKNFNLSQHDPKVIASVRDCVKEIEKFEPG
nr:unnamed protein product [Callosobruchus analis]